MDQGCSIQFGFAVFILFDFKNGMFHCHGAPQRTKTRHRGAQLIFSQRIPFTFHTRVCGLTLNNCMSTFISLFCNRVVRIK